MAEATTTIFCATEGTIIYSSIPVTQLDRDKSSLTLLITRLFKDLRQKPPAPAKNSKRSKTSNIYIFFSEVKNKYGIYVKVPTSRYVTRHVLSIPLPAIRWNEWKAQTRKLTKSIWREMQKKNRLAFRKEARTAEVPVHLPARKDAINRKGCAWGRSGKVGTGKRKFTVDQSHQSNQSAWFIHPMYPPDVSTRSLQGRHGTARYIRRWNIELSVERFFFAVPQKNNTRGVGREIRTLNRSLQEVTWNLFDYRKAVRWDKDVDG